MLPIQILIPINYVRICFVRWIFKVLYLVGEAAGKAPLGVIKKEDINANINQMRGKADSATSVVNDTRNVN